MSDEVLSKEEIEALIAQGGAATGQESVEKTSGGEEQTSTASDNQPEITVTADSDKVVRTMEFSPVVGSTTSAVRSGMDLIMDVTLQVTVELGRTRLKVRDVLALGPGAVVELDKHAGEPVDVVVNNKTIARGEVVVIDDNFGVRLTEIVDKEQRDVRAKAA